MSFMVIREPIFKRTYNVLLHIPAVLSRGIGNALASILFASQADFSPALLAEKARTCGRFEMTNERYAFVQRLHYSGQLFLNCDSFIFTSLALSVTCTCIGLSVLWS